jgi:predicted glycoside hydrolase/deacetylase ChbG (UPF0249 family)
MNIRAIRSSDYAQIQGMHSKFYGNEFSLPDFMTNYSGAFVIEDEDQIVSACGMRKIAEIVAMANKDLSARKRTMALLTGTEAVKFLADREGFDQIHAFVQGKIWIDMLLKSGFRRTKGESLVSEI